MDEVLTIKISFHPLACNLLNDLVSFKEHLSDAVNDYLTDAYNDTEETQFTLSLTTNSEKSMKAFTFADMGKKVKVIAKTSNHSVPIGTVGKSISVSNRKDVLKLEGFPEGGYLFLADVELLSESKEDLQKELKELQDRTTLITRKLAYLEQTGGAEFDDNEFKAFSILETLDDKSSNLDKAKKIAELFR